MDVATAVVAWSSNMPFKLTHSISANTTPIVSFGQCYNVNNGLQIGSQINRDPRLLVLQYSTNKLSWRNKVNSNPFTDIITTYNKIRKVILKYKKIFKKIKIKH